VFLVEQEENLSPVADANGPYTGYEGSPITFNGSGSYDPDDYIVSWEWDLDGDGIYETNATETNGTVNYTWCDDYFGNVSLKVTDSFGATDVDNTTVTVLNVPPTANAGPNQTVYAGDLVTFNGSATDPSCNDTLTFERDFGDGTNATGLNATHVYFDKENYTVTFTVTDDDGGVGTDTAIITVNSIPANVRHAQS
jgi:PKD repeat protein